MTTGEIITMIAFIATVTMLTTTRNMTSFRSTFNRKIIETQAQLINLPPSVLETNLQNKSFAQLVKEQGIEADVLSQRLEKIVAVLSKA